MNQHSWALLVFGLCSPGKQPWHCQVDCFIIQNKTKHPNSFPFEWFFRLPLGEKLPAAGLWSRLIALTFSLVEKSSFKQRLTWRLREMKFIIGRKEPFTFIYRRFRLSSFSLKKGVLNCYRLVYPVWTRLYNSVYTILSTSWESVTTPMEGWCTFL